MSKFKAVQYFSDEYLENCRLMKPDQIIKFLEDFRTLHAQVEPKSGKSKLISIKVPEDLLALFKKKSELNGIAYQTQIKKLMVDWVVSHAPPSEMAEP